MLRNITAAAVAAFSLASLYATPVQAGEFGLEPSVFEHAQDSYNALYKKASKVTNPEVVVDATQLHCLAEVIRHESIASKKLGAFAVGEVIFNRVESADFPNTICEVVYQPRGNGKHQFQYIDKGKKLAKDDPDYKLVQNLALAMLMEDSWKNHRLVGTSVYFQASEQPKRWHLKQVKEGKLFQYAYLGGQWFYANRESMAILQVASN